MTKVNAALAAVGRSNDVVERMSEAYWDAYRDGVMALGIKDYPTWKDFTEQRSKAETRRCMRYAVEVLRSLPDTAFTDPAKKADKNHVQMERGSLNAILDRVFPDKPVRRKKHDKMLNAEVQAQALNARAKLKDEKR